MMDKKNSGFFFEILVVVAVLTILAAIAIPSIGQLSCENPTETYESKPGNVQAGDKIPPIERRTG